ncbi:hypothetical protein UA08_00535 [Talaromyces atroroseus]|uniref:Uncharacterized protein n=1 Tax=Talaromyces atroroseus TaxID=1441469 RepID=A0A225B9V6_TALAT|nr:hypothetical protein UA08_00535 [Talaromyces atroroseus]OKL64176.1 hypothetical protein UA08_00535 [Talaromyces atroroseus]
MAPKTKKSVKDRMCERQNLIKAYDIVFDGPIAPRQWPRQYVPIFQKIRDIEDVKYERYVSFLTTEENETNDPLAPITDRVANLIRVAYDMRNSLANESTWRLHTESQVLGRFLTDLPCDHCRKKRWVSKFRLDPFCPLAAEKLRAKRARTSEESGKASHATAISGPSTDAENCQSANTLQSPFLYRSDEPVIDDSVPEYGTKELGVQKPDNVIGLRQTAKLQSLLSMKPDILDTPFKKNFSPSFPFLLLEAKPEHGCPGFTSVEEQSAFPLRTLLNIQKNIPTPADVQFNPLIWFMANQGDEWRIYACVPDGAKTRIIDLWHGSVLREDSALQLLFLVDMICDWARDIYRKEIMRCFAAAVSDSRGITPADSLISYNPFSGEETSPNQSDGYFSAGDSDSATFRVEDDSNENPIRSVSPNDSAVNQNEDIVTHSDSDSPTEVTSNPSTTTDTGVISLDTLTVSDVEMVDSDHEDVSEETSAETWTQHAVIKHANNVIFLFQTLSLPEAHGDLITLLTSPSTTSDVAQAAGKLVMLFCGQTQVLTRRSTIRRLGAWWTGANDTQEPYNSDLDDDSVIAHFSFESYFRRHDWELVRKLTCIMASSTAIENLAWICGINRPVINNYRGELRCTRSNFLKVTRFLRDLCGERSAKSGISHLHLYLCKNYASFERGRPQYEWKKSTPQMRDLLGTLQYTERLIRVSTSERYGQVNISVMQNMPLNLEFESKTQTIGAFLAKKPSSWPDTCPKYSLVVFDQSNIQDGHLMASKISDAILNQSFFHETGSGISQVDASAFTLWAKILRGETPSDHVWPS